MSTYAFMSIEKVKNYGTLSSKYKHNLREAEVKNADSALSYLNRSLVVNLDESGKQKNYADAVKERLDSLEYYQNRKIRDDQVKAYEIVLTYSKDDNVDIEHWQQCCMNWLKDTFDVAGDGKSNIISAEFHADETGNVHLHAIVTPVDERGHLNAVRFTGGARAMTDLQTSYADYVAECGIERGLAGSSARHKDLRKMYAALNNAMDIPKVLEGETAEEYRTRVLENLETSAAVIYKRASDYEIQERRKTDIGIKEQKKAFDEEYERTINRNEKYKEENKKLKKEMVNTISQIDATRAQLEELINEMYQMQIAKQNSEDDKKRNERYKNIERGLEELEKTNPEEFEEIKDMLEKAENLGARLNEIEEEEKQAKEI